MTMQAPIEVPSVSPPQLRALLDGIDIYLLDQILRGRITSGMRVLDAGCGTGRNVTYLLRCGFDVSAIDPSSSALAEVRSQANRLAPQLDGGNFRDEHLEAMTFDPASFDVVVCNAVLHFARDADHFAAMLDALGRVLKPGGVLFARLASSIGFEDHIRPVSPGRYALPDGTTRYLVDEAALLAATERLGGVLLDPIKTVNVQNLRCMTTWCLQKNLPDA
jgi:2-polyprenyl-3-methyl-5-hydroxy-6-metoxy-1,4-benzoquinol methylase